MISFNCLDERAISSWDKGRLEEEIHSTSFDLGSLGKYVISSQKIILPVRKAYGHLSLTNKSFVGSNYAGRTVGSERGGVERCLMGQIPGLLNPGYENVSESLILYVTQFPSINNRHHLLAC